MTLNPVCTYYTPGSGCEINRDFPSACRTGCVAYYYEPRSKAIQQQWYEAVYPGKAKQDNYHAETY